MQWLCHFGRDLRLAARGFRRSPVTAIAVVLTLALGVGANAAIYSVVYGVLMRPLPYRDPGALVQLSGVREGSARPINFSMTEFADWTGRSRAFETLALFGFNQFVLGGEGETEAIRGAVVSASFFDVMGARFAAGRPLGPEDDRTPAVAISDRLWQRRFGGRADIVGSRLTLNGQPYTIVGVASAQFRFPADDVELWTPAGFALSVAPPQWTMRGFRAFSIVGRLKPGVSLAQAGDDASTTARWLAQAYPRFNEHVGVTVVPLRDRLTATVRPVLLMLFGAVSLVLLVACANVANLSLVRSSARSREIAIRTALGAAPRQLATYFLAEGAILGGLAAVASLVFARVTVEALVRFHPAELPRLDEIRLDLPVLLFTFGVSAVATFLSATVPALVSRREPIAGLRDVRTAPAPRTGRLHAVLMVGEMALAVVLVVGATLFTRSLTALVRSDVGVRDPHVITMKLNLGADGLADPALLGRLLSDVSTLAGVRAAGTISSLPPNVSQMHTSFQVVNATTGAREDLAVEMIAASPDTFVALGVPLLRGRPFGGADAAESRRVVILSETAARRFFPHDDPLGRRLAAGPSDPRYGDPEVVGVVGNVKYSGLDAAPDGAIYMPYTQRSFRVMYLAVRTAGDPLGATHAIAAAIHGEDPSIAVSDVRTLDGLVADAAAQPRFRTWLLAALAGVASLLAGVGLYGVIAFAVGARTAEIGVRMALGATRGDVLSLVMRRGLALTAAGLAIGIVGALALRTTMASFLYGVAPTDPTSFAVAAAFIVAIGLVATIVPAWRATMVDPLVALRAE